jgi:hypothetical protein
MLMATPASLARPPLPPFSSQQMNLIDACVLG